jgi:hypothetical protein
MTAAAQKNPTAIRLLRRMPYCLFFEEPAKAEPF